jgi:hypothetical protein
MVFSLRYGLNLKTRFGFRRLKHHATKISVAGGVAPPIHECQLKLRLCAVRPWFDCRQGQPSLESNVYRGVKQPEFETDNATPFRAEVKNSWSLTSTPPCVFTVLRLFTLPQVNFPKEYNTSHAFFSRVRNVRTIERSPPSVSVSPEPHISSQY